MANAQWPDIAILHRMTRIGAIPFKNVGKGRLGKKKLAPLPVLISQTPPRFLIGISGPLPIISKSQTPLLFPPPAHIFKRNSSICTQTQEVGRAVTPAPIFSWGGRAGYLSVCNAPAHPFPKCVRASCDYEACRHILQQKQMEFSSFKMLYLQFHEITFTSCLEANVYHFQTTGISILSHVMLKQALRFFLSSYIKKKIIKKIRNIAT